MFMPSLSDNDTKCRVLMTVVRYRIWKESQINRLFGYLVSSLASIRLLFMFAVANRCVKRQSNQSHANAAGNQFMHMRQRLQKHHNRQRKDRIERTMIQ